MSPHNLSDSELIHAVDSDPSASAREKELAARLFKALDDLHLAGEGGILSLREGRGSSPSAPARRS